MPAPRPRVGATTVGPAYDGVAGSHRRTSPLHVPSTSVGWISVVRKLPVLPSSRIVWFFLSVWTLEIHFILWARIGAIAVRRAA